MRTMALWLALFGLSIVSAHSVADEKAEGKKGAVVGESAPHNFVYGTFLYHVERRDYEKERYADGFVGFDHLLNPETNVWIGARAGFYSESVLTSIPIGTKHQRPAVGFHVFKLLPFEKSLAFKLGGGADVLYAGSDFDFPLWLYAGGEAGFRLYVVDNVYAEIPVELGFFPFFDGTPIYSKIGFQLGFGF